MTVLYRFLCIWVITLCMFHLIGENGQFSCNRDALKVSRVILPLASLSARHPVHSYSGLDANAEIVYRNAAPPFCISRKIENSLYNITRTWTFAEALPNWDFWSLFVHFQNYISTLRNHEDSWMKRMLNIERRLAPLPWLARLRDGVVSFHAGYCAWWNLWCCRSSSVIHHTQQQQQDEKQQMLNDIGLKTKHAEQPSRMYLNDALHSHCSEAQLKQYGRPVFSRWGKE